MILIFYFILLCFGLKHNGIKNKTIPLTNKSCVYSVSLDIQKFLIKKICAEIKYSEKGLNLTCTPAAYQEYKYKLTMREFLEYLGFSKDDNDPDSIMTTLNIHPKMKEIQTWSSNGGQEWLGLLFSDKDLKDIGNVYPYCEQIVNFVQKSDDNTGLIIIFTLVGVAALGILGGFGFFIYRLYKRSLNTKVIISKVDDKVTEVELKF